MKRWAILRDRSKGLYVLFDMDVFEDNQNTLENYIFIKDLGELSYEDAQQKYVELLEMILPSKKKY